MLLDSKYKNSLILAFIMLIFAPYSIGQKQCESKSRKARRLYEKGREMLDSRNKTERKSAYKQLVEAAKEDPDYADVNFVLGRINFSKSLKEKNLQKKKQSENRALKYFEKVVQHCPESNDFEACFLMGNIYYKRTDYISAKDKIEWYLNESKNRLYAKEAEKILEHLEVYFYLINNPVEFEPKIVKGVSTDEDEFLPMISPDGQLAIYTHRYLLKDEGTQRGRLVDELSVSQKSTTGNGLEDYFSKGQKMPYPFNVEGLNQGAMSMTIDNSELYITICKLAKSSSGPFNNCDIYVSYNRGGKWTELKNLGPNINGKYSWESQPSISADGKTLFFASVRPDNIGFDYNNNQTSDIYYSTKDARGHWSKAKNIGTPINTKGNEKSPFLHTDSQTLYFSSDELPGVGGYDIFFSKEVQGKWQQPVNIGYPINKETNDLGFFVSTNGKKAYFSSDKLGDSKRWNVYSFNLYEKARPEKVFFAKGKLIDEKGKAITDAKIEIKTSGSEKVSTGIVNKETGDYAIAVAVQKDEEILMTVKKKGHAFSSRYFKQDEEVTNKPLDVAIEVKKIKAGTSVEINDINFATNSSELTKGSRFILDNFSDYMKENPSIRIEIHGHTDNVGKASANLILSKDRARSVMEYLIEKGVDKIQIKRYRGFGATKPIASNKTQSGRAKNRRTEFLIIKN